ncbi:hypothetical protein M9H77_18670 [Catharanthus roseus]|uniref:Uncharacterized protein n=1 Tax=Catharanthus roseus TaxID=4058 RepID=A0ACC0B852_CATRO|nr:hypothetical protein M9H77_18670 [Catharanthus roseus]
MGSIEGCLPVMWSYEDYLFAIGFHPTIPVGLRRKKKGHSFPKVLVAKLGKKVLQQGGNIGMVMIQFAIKLGFYIKLVSEQTPIKGPFMFNNIKMYHITKDYMAREYVEIKSSRVDECYDNVTNHASCVLGTENEERGKEKELGICLEDLPISPFLNPSLSFHEALLCFEFLFTTLLLIMDHSKKF